MRTLHLGLRVTDLDRSLAYCRAVGSKVAGEVRDTDMDATCRRLEALGIDLDEPTSPDGSPDFWTIMLTDPDGNRIEAERARLAERYLGDLAARYLEATKGEATVIVRLTPERWRTQDYSQISV